MKGADRQNRIVWLLRIFIVALALFQGYILHRGNMRIADEATPSQQVQR